MNSQFRTRRRTGFALVELVIVVLVLGIITAVAAPKMFDTANDARDSATRQSLTVLRDSIELHRAQNGAYPTAAGIATALVPFLQGPFPAPQAGANQNATAVASTQNPIVAPEAGTAGWAYNQTTGEIRVNDATLVAW
jgi:general secretion pathway protein G